MVLLWESSSRISLIIPDRHCLEQSLPFTMYLVPYSRELTKDWMFHRCHHRNLGRR